MSLNNLGLAQSRLRRTADAERSFRQALDLQESLVRQNPHDLDLQSNLGGIYNNLGMLLEQLQRNAEAADDYRHAVEHQQIASAHAPQVSRYRAFLSKHYYNYGRVLRRLGRPDEAARVALARRELVAERSTAPLRRGRGTGPGDRAAGPLPPRRRQRAAVCGVRGRDVAAGESRRLEAAGGSRLEQIVRGVEETGRALRNLSRDDDKEGVKVMAENRKRLTGRSQKQPPECRRHLRFEPLESRSLLSVVAVAAPSARANLPSVEWLPPRPEAVFSADARENANLSVQTEAPLLSLPLRGLSNSVAAPLAPSPDRLLPLEGEVDNVAPFSTGHPHDLISESMATLAQLPPSATISFNGRTSPYDLVNTGDSFAGVAPHEEFDSSSGSIAGLPTALPESRLSVEVIFAGMGPAFASYGGSPTGRSAAMPQSAPLRLRVSPRPPQIPFAVWRPSWAIGRTRPLPTTAALPSQCRGSCRCRWRRILEAAVFPSPRLLPHPILGQSD